MILNKQAGSFFQSFADSFTSAQGLDQILKDLNSGDNSLRDEVLKCIGALMSTDDLVCIKFMKLKVVSNIIRHLLLPGEIDQKYVNIILQSFLDCKHRATLLEHSEQFKPEKERLQLILKEAKSGKYKKAMHKDTIDLLQKVFD